MIRRLAAWIRRGLTYEHDAHVSLTYPPHAAPMTRPPVAAQPFHHGAYLAKQRAEAARIAAHRAEAAALFFRVLDEAWVNNQFADIVEAERALDTATTISDQVTEADRINRAKGDAS